MKLLFFNFVHTDNNQTRAYVAENHAKTAVSVQPRIYCSAYYNLVYTAVSLYQFQPCIHFSVNYNLPYIAASICTQAITDLVSTASRARLHIFDVFCPSFL